VEGPPPSLVRLCGAVDTILAAVEQATIDSPGPAQRDLNDTFLTAAYGRAYRCLRSIRQLAGRGEADDALILTRALLSVVARSLYVVQPERGDERERRAAMWRRTWAEDALRAIDDLSASGFEPEDDRDRIERIAEAEKGRGVPRLPNDRDLLMGLGLSIYYARVYRLTSDVVHYSIGNMLDGFLEYPDKVVGGGRVGLKLPDGRRAEEALWLAAIVFGQFLELSEPIIRHGVTPTARREIAEYMNEKAIAEAATRD
jgi:hypothetical protein